MELLGQTQTGVYFRGTVRPVSSRPAEVPRRRIDARPRAECFGPLWVETSSPGTDAGVNLPMSDEQ